MTAPASVYPVGVEELLPAAQEIARRLGKTPTRNVLMRELRIGAPKATALADMLKAYLIAGTGVLETHPEPTPDPVPQPSSGVDLTDGDGGFTPNASPLAAVDGHPGTEITNRPGISSGESSPVAPVAVAEAPARAAVRRPAVRSWPVVLIALPAFVAIWSGWVGLGELTGFGVVHPLPGIADGFAINSAITLPIGVEVYAAYALRVWLSGDAVPRAARRFARWSAITSLLVGAAGQVAYHLMESAGITSAPWQITTAVACLPVAVLGMGAALAHLISSGHDDA